MKLFSVQWCAVWMLLALTGAARAQTCTPSTNAVPIQSEAISSKLADIVITCTGGTPGVSVAGSIFVSYTANITNRLDNDGAPTGITLSYGGTTGTAFQINLSSPSVLATNFRYTVPPVPATPVTLTLAGVRSGVGLAPAAGSNIAGAVTLTGLQFPAAGVPLVVAVSARSLAATVLNNGLPCGGSALPSTLDYASFAGGALSSTIRVTEATNTAFTIKQAGDDTGARLLVRFSGYGAGVRIFVPDAIAGSTGATVTSAGAFLTSVSGGSYAPGTNQLLLSRVQGADSNGSGGNPVQAVPAALTAFNGVTELTVTNGSAFAVYEVMDANPLVREYAYLPAFFVYAQNNCSQASQTAMSVTLGPVSTVAAATQTDPIPRFAAVAPGSDCELLTDCNAIYYPRLSVDPTSLTITGSSLGPVVTTTVRVGNSGGSQMVFNTSIAYPPGQATGWLTVNPTTGINNVTLNLNANPGALPQGTYGATITVNAGSAGTLAIPVAFNVGPTGPTIQSVVNAASFQAGPIVPGSYVALFGLNLTGTNAQVLFTGLPGQITFRNSTQINLVVPPTLSAAPGSTDVVVTIDGKTSNTFRAAVAPNAPGIFTPGIVNLDGSVNSATQPAVAGGFVAVYLTGLANPLTGPVTVNLAGLVGLVPAYAGPQGTFPGLAQVNIQIPPGMNGSVPMTICTPGLSGQPVCSNPVNVFVR